MSPPLRTSYRVREVLIPDPRGNDQAANRVADDGKRGLH